MVTLMSALAPRVAVVAEVLFAADGSGVVADARVAVFSMLPVAAGETAKTSVNVAGLAGANAAMVHVVVAPTVAHVNAGPPVCVAETNVVFAGPMSVRVTFAAVEGPPFVATTV